MPICCDNADLLLRECFHFHFFFLFFFLLDSVSLFPAAGSVVHTCILYRSELKTDFTEHKARCMEIFYTTTTTHAAPALISPSPTTDWLCCWQLSTRIVSERCIYICTYIPHTSVYLCYLSTGYGRAPELNLASSRFAETPRGC